MIHSQFEHRSMLTKDILPSMKYMPGLGKEQIAGSQSSLIAFTLVLARPWVLRKVHACKTNSNGAYQKSERPAGPAILNSKIK